VHPPPPGSRRPPRPARHDLPGGTRVRAGSAQRGVERLAEVGQDVVDVLDAMDSRT